MKESSVTSVTTATFDAAILATPHPVVVDFWAAWCQPCLRVSPVLEALAAARTDTLTVLKVNVDEESTLARRFNVQSIPTLIRFDAGLETHRTVGALPQAQLVAGLGLEV